MTVYTGLLDEDATTVDGVPMMPPDWLDTRPIFEVFDELDGEDGSCWCDGLGPRFQSEGVVCTGEGFRWTPDLPPLRFDRPFTPPYAAVRRG